MEANKRNFEIIARAVIVKNGEILLCKPKGESWYFFPGGHVDFGERVEDALKREMMEELNVAVRGTSFIGAVESYFGEEGKEHHEMNIAFVVELEEGLREMENHIEFGWISLNSFCEAKTLPSELKTLVLRWMDDKKCFWGSDFELPLS